MDWFYSEKDERKGPVSEAQAKALIAARTITPETLVWNQSMTDWKSAKETILFSGRISVSANPDEHLCIITGKTFPASQMIKTDHGWVSVDGKEMYYQSLREGASIPLADGLSNARADGKNIIIPIMGGRLPNRCVKTNQPVTETDVKRKALYWCHPAIFLTFLINILVVLILYYVLRKKVMIDIPLSQEGSRIVRKNKIISWALFLGGIALTVMGLMGINGPLDDAVVPAIPVGMLVLLFGIVFSGRKAVALRVVKLKGDEAWLGGASKEFVASLPPRI